MIYNFVLKSQSKQEIAARNIRYWSESIGGRQDTYKSVIAAINKKVCPWLRNEWKKKGMSQDKIHLLFFALNKIQQKLLIKVVKGFLIFWFPINFDFYLSL